MGLALRDCLPAAGSHHFGRDVYSPEFHPGISGFQSLPEYACSQSREIRVYMTRFTPFSSQLLPCCPPSGTVAIKTTDQCFRSLRPQVEFSEEEDAQHTEDLQSAMREEQQVCRRTLRTADGERH